ALDIVFPGEDGAAAGECQRVRRYQQGKGGGDRGGHGTAFFDPRYSYRRQRGTRAAPRPPSGAQNLAPILPRGLKKTHPSECKNVKLQTLTDVSGNQCGYVTIQITCTQ